MYDRRALRKYLQSLLPYYMIPTAIIEIPEIPLSVQGKLDKRALPVLEGLDREQQVQSDFAAPQTETEKVLADIWADVLQVGQVGIHDNFFELGGDSIISIRVISKARDKGLGITIKQIFEFPTVSELSRNAKALGVRSQKSEKVTGHLPNFPVHEWFFQMNMKNPNHFNQAEIFTVSSAISSEVLQKSLTALITHHDALRIAVSGSSQEIRDQLPDDEQFFHVVNVTEEPEIEQKIKETQSALSLSRCLIRAVLFIREGATENYLFIAIHHLAVDAVSWSILLEDLESALKQLKSNEVCFFCKNLRVLFFLACVDTFFRKLNSHLKLLRCWTGRGPCRAWHKMIIGIQANANFGKQSLLPNLHYFQTSLNNFRE